MEHEALLALIRQAVEQAVRYGLDRSHYETQDALVSEALTALLDGTDLEGVLIVKYSGGEVKMRPYRGEDVVDPIEVSSLRNSDINSAFHQALASEGFQPDTSSNLSDAWNDTIILSQQDAINFLTALIEEGKTSKRFARNFYKQLGL